MSLTPNVIRVIVEGELVPAVGLVLGGGPPSIRSRSYPRHHAEYHIEPPALGRQHIISFYHSPSFRKGLGVG